MSLSPYWCVLPWQLLTRLPQNPAALLPRHRLLSDHHRISYKIVHHAQLPPWLPSLSSYCPISLFHVRNRNPHISDSRTDILSGLHLRSCSLLRSKGLDPKCSCRCRNDIPLHRCRMQDKFQSLWPGWYFLDYCTICNASDTLSERFLFECPDHHEWYNVEYCIQFLSVQT